MRFSYPKTHVVAFILLVIPLGAVESWQLIPSTIHEPLEITKRERNSKSDPISSHDTANQNLHRRYPSRFGYFSNRPLKPELLFHGGPCCPIQAIGCGGFSCGCGIGFPITSVSCCGEMNKPKEENTTAKRFDITGIPASHPPKTVLRKRPQPSKDDHRNSKPKESDENPANEGPNMHHVHLDDGHKAPEEIVVGHPLQHRPWFPYLHRPLHPIHIQPHFVPHHMPHAVGLQPQNYWQFQGYFPHFMSREIPWEMNPYDMRNVPYYPEYQYGDVQFTPSRRPFRSRPPFRDYNDLSSEVKLLDQPEELQEDVTHNKQKVGSQKDHSQLPEEARKMAHNPEGLMKNFKAEVQEDMTHSKHKVSSQTDHSQFHDEDRKMVDNQEDSTESFTSNEFKHKGTVESAQGEETNQDAVKEDASKNYPEYASEFNTDRFWSSVDKRQGTIKNPLDENAIFKNLNQQGQGFDLDDISTSYLKRTDQSKKMRKVRKENKVRPGLGDVKIKYDPLISATK